MTEQSMQQLPSVNDFVKHIVVQKVNGQQFVKLQDFQAVVQLGQALEEQLTNAIHYFGDEQEKTDLLIKGQAMDAASTVAAGDVAKDPKEALELFTTIFTEAIQLLTSEFEYQTQEAPSEAPVDPGEALAALSKGDS